MIEGGSLPYTPNDIPNGKSDGPKEKIGAGALLGGAIGFASAAGEGAAAAAVLASTAAGALTLGGVVVVGVGACFVVKSVWGLFR